jgi:hypothetical protein
LSASTGNYLYSAASSNLVLGTNTFTLEYWVRNSDVTVTNRNAVCFGNAGGSPLFGYTNNGDLRLYLASSNSSGWDIASNVLIGNIVSNVWYHVAVVRNVNTYYTFLNGNQVSTFTNASSIYQANNTMGIGVGENGVYPFNGYVTNVRFVRGTALYTSNFTPSTIPLAAITNTQLLFNSVSGAPFADGSTNALTFTRTGTPAWNQLSPFATGLGYKNRVYTWTSSGTVTF